MDPKSMKEIKKNELLEKASSHNLHLKKKPSYEKC